MFCGLTLLIFVLLFMIELQSLWVFLLSFWLSVRKSSSLKTLCFHCLLDILWTKQSIVRWVNRRIDFRETALIWLFDPVFPLKGLEENVSMIDWLNFFFFFIIVYIVCIPEAITYSAVQTHDTYLYFVLKKIKKLCKLYFNFFEVPIQFYLTNQGR